MNNMKFMYLLLICILSIMIIVTVRENKITDKIGDKDDNSVVENNDNDTENISQSHQDVVENNITINSDNIGDNGINSDSIDVPEFNVELWDYSPDCGINGFFGSCQPQKYIMPNNDVIKFVASIMTIDEKGRLLWEKCPLGGCGIFDNVYISDREQFDKEDFWINPDYYFMNRIKGDCEDSAFAIASVLEVKGIKTRIVGGYVNNGNVRDWIVEYKINETYYRYYGGISYDIIDGVQQEVGFKKRDVNIDFFPIVMFGKDTYYQSYNSNW